MGRTQPLGGHQATPVPQEAEFTRLRLFLHATFWLNIAFGMVTVTAGTLLSNPRLLFSSMLHAIHVPPGLISLCLLRRGRRVGASLWATCSFFTFAAVAAPLWPFLLPGLVLVPIIGVFGALPQVEGRTLRAVLAGCLASELAVGASSFVSPLSRLPKPLEDFLFFSSLSAAALVMLLLLSQYNARLRETLAEARADEERFRSLALATAQVVWVARPDGSLLNDEAESWRAFTGPSMDTPHAEGWLAAVHPRDRERVRHLWDRALARREPFVVEFRVRRADGHYVPMLVRATPVLNADGSVREWVGANADISARLESDRMLRRALEARDDFLGQASHELRTPLTSLKLQVQMLRGEQERAQDSPIPAEHLKGRLDVIERQVARLGDLIHDLLDVSQIDAGQLGLVRAEVDLSQVVRDVVAEHRERAHKAGCELLLRGAEVRALGLWDGPRLAQVLGHLLVNAFRYGAGAPVEVSITVNAETARVSVKDHGVGIAPKDHERIFERFERASSGRHYGGVGLGLWICRHIVSELGGELCVESRLGEGSDFWMELPRTGLTAETSAGPSAATP